MAINRTVLSGSMTITNTEWTALADFGGRGRSADEGERPAWCDTTCTESALDSWLPVHDLNFDNVTAQGNRRLRAQIARAPDEKSGSSGHWVLTLLVAVSVGFTRQQSGLHIIRFTVGYNSTSIASARGTRWSILRNLEAKLSVGIGNGYAGDPSTNVTGASIMATG
ncbi:hypothetical protein LXA43DRAFT_1066521 [Ganoderma leucocontextum]|nr:hypothetical protein LXA43DRAFT_1066521 [Ganoderma leucocontextum]